MRDRRLRRIGRNVLVPALVAVGLLVAPASAFAVAAPVITLASSAGTPAATTTKMGSTFNLDVTFDNNDGGNLTGFAPFVDFYVDTVGADGAGVAVDDGLEVGSIQFAGQALTPTVVACAGVPIPHPGLKESSGELVPCPFGRTFIYVALPFGSFTRDQPPATLTVPITVSKLADDGVALNVDARGGYRLGGDALENPADDAPVRTGAAVVHTVTPAAFDITKRYLGPEQETATGPNNPQRYRVSIDLADGHQLYAADITDLLPNTEVCTRVTAYGGSAGSTVAGTVPAAPFACTANTAAVTWTVINGTTADEDAWIEYEFYVPYREGEAAPPADVVLGNANVFTGADRNDIDNLADGGGRLWPFDVRDRTCTGPPVAPACAAPDAGTPIVTRTSDDDRTTIGDQPERIQGEALAIQKGFTVDGGGPLLPGSTLTFTIQGQVSDYYAMDDIVVTDTLRDGLVYTSTPTLAYAGSGGVSFLAGAFGATNVGTPDVAAPFEQDLTFDVSSEIEARLPGTAVTEQFVFGGCVDPAGTDVFGGLTACPTIPNYDDGRTSFTITYKATVLDDFRNGALGSVDAGDGISNTASATANLVQTTAGHGALGATTVDDTAASGQIGRGSISKSIIAVDDALAGPKVARPGDRVTYNVTYDLPVSDVEGLYVDDFLPKPVLDATTVNALFATKLAPTAYDTDAEVAALATGTVYFLAEDDFTVLGVAPNGTNRAPTLSTNGPSNYFRINYGDWNQVGNQARKISFIYSVIVSNDPFADSLLLTNQAETTTENSLGAVAAPDAYDRFVIREPQLRVRKGVVATSQPPANTTFTSESTEPWALPVNQTLPPGTTIPAPPAAISLTASPALSARIPTDVLPNPQYAASIDANVVGVDGSDVVRYASTLRNEGGEAAYDVRFCDEEPPGAQMALVPGSLRLYRGDGTALTAGVDYTGTEANFFDCAAGLEMVDNNAIGSSDTGLGAVKGAGSPGLLPGHDVVVAIYDFTVNADAQPANTAYTNESRIYQYTNHEGGTDFINPGDPTVFLSNTATVVPQLRPVLAKSIIASSDAGTTGANLAIGERAQYQVVVTIPEGRTRTLQVVDTLDDGLALTDDAVTIAASANVTCAATACAAVVPTKSGDNRTLTVNLGNVTNADTTNVGADTVTITYWAMVRDTLAAPSNVHGATRRNTVTATHLDCDANAGTLLVPDCPTQRQTTITIVEPDVNVDKGVGATPAATPVASLAVDASDSTTWTIDLTNAAGRPTAYDVSFDDDIPVGIAFTADSMTLDGPGAGAATSLATCDDLPVNTPRTYVIDGVTVTCTFTDADSFRIDVPTLPGGTAWRLQYGTTIDQNNAVTGLALTNDVDAEWQSLPDGTASACNTDIPNTCRLRTSTDADTATVTVSFAQPTKTRGTPLAATTAGANDAVIGERVTYTVRVPVPEGRTRDLRIVDDLAAGLGFVGPLSSIAVSYENFATTVDLVPPVDGGASGGSKSTGTPGTGYDFAVAGGDGGVLTVDFDDFYNRDADADQEHVVLTYDVQVLNVIGNQAPNTRTNGMQVRYLTPAGVEATPLTPVTPPTPVTIREPNVTMAKALTPFTDSGNDYLRVTLTATNTSAYTAHDVVVGDDLTGTDLQYAAMPAPTCALTVVAPGACTTPTYAGGTEAVTATLATLAPSQVATVTFTTRVASTHEVGSTGVTGIRNTGTVRFTSLPAGDEPAATCLGTVPAAACTERTGADGEGGVLDDYADDVVATAASPSPTIAKAIVATSGTHTSEITTPRPVVVGERVRYQLTVTLPRGTTTNLTITDRLGRGLAFEQASSVTYATSGFATPPTLPTPPAGITVAPAPAAAAPDNADLADRQATFALGTIVNDETDTAAETITITYWAVVRNDAYVQGGVQVGNAARLTHDADGATLPAVTTTGPTIEVVEPAVDVVKALAREDIAGEEYVRVTLTATNTSTVAAFDVDVYDDLAGTNLAWAPAATHTCALTVPTAACTAPSYPLAGYSATTAGTTIASLAPSQVATVVVYTRVSTGFEVGSTGIANTGRVRWTSLPAAEQPSAANCTLAAAICAERTGTGVGPNDYEDTDARSLASETPSVTKSIVATSAAHTADTPAPVKVAVGERVQYQVRVLVPRGTTNAVTVVDRIGRGMAFDVTQAPVYGTTGFQVGTVPTLPAAPAAPINGIVDAAPPAAGDTTDLDGRRITFALGNVVNADTDDTDEYVTITYWAVVQNASYVNATPTTQVFNSAALTYTVAAVPTAGGTAVAPPVEVVESKLVITKTIAPTLLDAGQDATITLTIAHDPASTADAQAAMVNDLLPEKMLRTGALVPAFTPTCTIDAVPAGGACTTTNVPGPPARDRVTVAVGAIPLGQTRVIRFNVRMRGDVAPAELISNTGTVDWRSLPATDGTTNACETTLPTPACVARGGSYLDPANTLDDYTAASTAVVSGATVSSIAGTVWQDDDNDGVIDVGEPRLGGVTVTLTGLDLLGNPVLLTTTSDVVTGAYEFAGLRPGTYQVTETQPATHLDGKDRIGHFGDNVPKGAAGGNDRTIDIVLPIGASTTAVAYDFGELLRSSLAGIVWGENRTSENGVYDAGTDTPLGGVTVTLTGTDDLGPITPIVVTTNAAGAYVFPNLRPGTYVVTETQPAGWGEGAAHVGTGAATPGTLGGTNVIQGVTLTSNQDAVAYDFHEIERANVRIAKAVVAPGAPGGIVGRNTQFTWRLTVTNDGPSPVTNLQFEDDLAAIAEAGLTVLSVTPSAGTTCSPWTPAPAAPVTRNLTCATPTLGIAPANVATVDLLVRADATPTTLDAPFVNAARITGIDQLGDDPADNAATSQVIVRDAEIGVVKTGSATRLLTGQQVEWNVRVTNNGPGSEPAVTLADQLPAQAMVLSITPSKGTCGTGGAGVLTLQCSLGAMAAGDVVDIKVVAMLPEAGTYRNVATVTLPGTDRDPSNQTSTHTVVVTAPGVADCTVEGSGAITGTGGNDIICGGGGDDVITCSGGDDIIVAGGGADRITCTPANCAGGAPTILGGVGGDIITVGCGGAIINGGDGNDTITLNGSEPGIAYGGAGNDRITGGGGADTLCGNAGNDVIVGGGGNDLIDGGANDDTINGQRGNNRIYGGAGNDTVRAGIGNDRVFGGLGNDRLFGERGSDTMYGELGNDQLDGGPGRDSVHGGNGNDTFRMKDRVADRIIGGRGRDTLYRDRRLDRWTTIERLL